MQVVRFHHKVRHAAFCPTVPRGCKARITAALSNNMLEVGVLQGLRLICFYTSELNLIIVYMSRLSLTFDHTLTEHGLRVSLCAAQEVDATFTPSDG